MNISNKILLLLSLSLTISCATGLNQPLREERNKFRDSLNSKFSKDFAETLSFDIYYATNREILNGKAGCDDTNFGVTAGPKTSYGKCEVSVPHRHPVGSIEFSNRGEDDSNRYFKIGNHTDFQQDDLKKLIQEEKPKQLLIFTHGFNVKFKDAILRASQIAYDIKFQGMVILLSWPAGSGQGFLDGTLINKTYEANRLNAAASIQAFSDFFNFIFQFDGAKFLIVHSMGHQVVIPALSQSSGALTHSMIDELILNAPDISTEDFSNNLVALKKVAKRITVYCSFNDNAIAASETYNKSKRIGACTMADGVDVINASEIDAPVLKFGGLGHSYYSSRPILGDIYQLILGLDAEKRLFIRRSESKSTENFFLRP